MTETDTLSATNGGLTGDLDDRRISRRPSRKYGASCIKGVTGKLKTGLAYLFFAAAIGGAGLYVGVTRSDDIESEVYRQQKNYAISNAPKYNDIVSQIRTANRVFTHYNEDQTVDRGLGSICAEINSHEDFECRRR